jgi:hypothetical protein
MVRCVSEHDQLSENGDALTALEPAHVAAFAAFSRAAEKTDLAVATAPRAAPHLSPSLNPRLARRVYAGEQGTIYIAVPRLQAGVHCRKRPGGAVER